LHARRHPDLVKVGSAAAASCGKCAEVCNAEPILQMQWADEEFESSNGPACRCKLHCTVLQKTLACDKLYISCL